MSRPTPCTYVTQSWGVHDERWVVALRDNTFNVTTMSVERDNTTIDEIRQVLEVGEGPVLAGPLTSITSGLVGISRPLYGLSWGFDLVEAKEKGADLRWLTQLSGLVVDAPHTQEIAQNAGLEESRIHTIPWGVDLNRFSPEGPKSTTRVPVHRRLILSLRALEKKYRVSDIVDAFSVVAPRKPDVHLVIGNDGSLRKALTSLVAQRGLSNQVIFTGRLREEELPALLRAAEVYVSASEVDGSSVTLLQAMACGTTAVVSDTPGNLSWIEPERSGFTFATGDSHLLASALQRALDLTQPRRTEMLRAARETVAGRADWNVNSRRLATILR